MTRIPLVCTAAVTLVAVGLLASTASAESITVHTPTTPKVTVHPPSPQWGVGRGITSTTGANYRQGGTQSPVMKLPPRTKYDSITVNRGVTSNQSFQQWQQGVSGGGGASVSGGAATKCYGC